MASSEVKQMQEHLREVSDEELEMLIDTVVVKPPLSPPPPPPARKGMIGAPSKDLEGDAEKLSKAWGLEAEGSGVWGRRVPIR